MPREAGATELTGLRAAEAVEEAVEHDVAGLLTQGREAFGVTGHPGRWPLRSALRASGSGLGPDARLTGLVFADAAVGSGLINVQSQVQSALGGGALAQFVVLRPAAFFLGGLLALLVPSTRLHRVGVARGAAGVSGLAMVGAALSTSEWLLLPMALVAAFGSGLLAGSVVPVLIEINPPGTRFRVVAGVAAALVCGIGAGSLILAVGLSAGWTWHSQLLLIAALPLVALILSVGSVPDDRPGGRDSDPVRRLVEGHLGFPAGPPDDGAEDVAIGVGRQLGRVVRTPAAAPLLFLAVICGAFLWALPAFVDVLLRDRWGLVDVDQLWACGGLFLFALLAPVAVAARAEEAFRERPSRLLAVVPPIALATGAFLAVAAFGPNAVVMWAALSLTFVGFAILLAVAAFVTLSLAGPTLRAHAAVLVGTALLLGGILGQQLMQTLGTRFGAGWALASLSILLVQGAAGLRRSVRSIDADFDSLVSRTLELHEVTSRRRAGEHIPLLSCRRLDFSYGQVQVLFNVSFTVDYGEMVALLGTNGAGKSTLLRLVSGLGSPTAGTVHYRGRDITFTATDHRVDLGITQIPGGRAVFGPMSVVDNLRVYGFTHGRHRGQLDAAIDEVFALLPRLGERRNQLAATLSGGEQQMLALGAAHILKPRLLLIDELSLGLAPVIVGQLLEMVRRINDSGTAIVLVEQSANIALNLVDHAYFMEKGEMRFDGAAKDLLNRTDLLRSVFLEGASKALGMVK